LKRRRFFARGPRTETLARRALETEPNQDTIVNSRIALRNAKALAGSCAFACAVSLALRGLPQGQTYEHRESEDRSPPGGRRV
jgi:hypothetical protein